MFVTPAFAVPGITPADTDDSSNPTTDDDQKTADELLLDAEQLFAAGHPIDARSKLLKAVKKAPNDYRPYMGLSEYFLAQVGHFSLAYRYAHQAEDLFEKQYGSDRDGTLQTDAWRQHAHLLYVLSEAALNFDRYEESLEVLDRFGRVYWDGWYPGTKAWVLMKLKRIDDGIREAQAGLLRGANPGRTYNILGILLSVKGSRELSLEAFARAITSELTDGGEAQPATPLNNAGEVYRELFQDNYAEAAWKAALQFPDGCDHILPSLNLATLYIDELRLFQAERVLSDFEACYAEHSFRTDSEHRSLLALSRGRIALRKGNVDEALKQLSDASDRQQWFGKIGTNENDVRFSASISLAQALAAKAAALEDTKRATVRESLQDAVAEYWYRVRAWWQNRRAQDIAIDELSDFEDLFIRNTDAMLEYPTMGSMIAGYPEDAADRRLNRMIESDHRGNADSYYQLYLGTNQAAHGDNEQALSTLEKAEKDVRPIDRLLKAEILARKIRAKDDATPFWHTLTKEEQLERGRSIEKLYELLPSHVRFYDMSLPALVTFQGTQKEVMRKLEKILFSRRFHEVPAALQSDVRYLILLRGDNSSTDTASGTDARSMNLSIELKDQQTKSSVVVQQATVNVADKGKLEAFVNDFIQKAFSHQSDPPSEPTPNLPIMKGVLAQ